jgi:hypothetical protein
LSIGRVVIVGAVLLAVGLALKLALATQSSLEIGRDRPTTLVTAGAPIHSFAQSGDVLAWASKCKVRERSVKGGSTALLGTSCQVDAFALAGTRAIWGGFTDCCIEGYGTIQTGERGGKQKTLRDINQAYHSWGDFLTGAAGGGDTLVYSLTMIDISPGKTVDESAGWVHCLPHDPCTWDVTGGGVWRVVGTKMKRIAGTPPTALLAAVRGKIALVPADRRRIPGPCTDEDSTGCPEVRTADGARVEVRDVASGRITASFKPRGRVTALALDSKSTAVLVRSKGKARVEWYGTSSGKKLGAVSVSTKVAKRIAVSRRTVVFARGHTIFALDIRAKRVRELAQAGSAPIGLSIEGARVAWAENKGKSGSIRAIDVR